MSGKERGCGTRVVGGIYAEVHQSPDGMPVEYFLIDPPLVLDTKALGIRPIGVSVVQRGGLFHVFDQVGEDGYPNVADFVEETKVMGASRRLPKTMDFSKLEPGSRLLLLHRRAHIANFRDYYRATRWTCPKHLAIHDPEHDSEMCAGLWWQDITGGLVLMVAGVSKSVATRAIERVLPSLVYRGQRTPDGVKPQYQVAAFMSLPISNLAVIRDPEGDSHAEALDKTKGCLLPVTLEDA